MSVITPGALGQFADLVNESIQDIFVKRAKFPTQMEKYFNVKDTSSYYTKDSSVTGVDAAHYIGENASVTYDAPLQGYDKVYTQSKFGVGLKITDQLWKYGIEFRKITGLVETLADACRNKVEEDAADMLNSTSTSYTDADGRTVSTAGGDSVAYFSASHTREDGGTAWNNIVYDGKNLCCQELCFA